MTTGRASSKQAAAGPSVPAAISRRKVFAGAGTAGALAAAVALLPRKQAEAPPGPRAGAGAAAGDGYQLTEHVKRYYRTARV